MLCSHSFDAIHPYWIPYFARELFLVVSQNHLKVRFLRSPDSAEPLAVSDSVTKRHSAVYKTLFMSYSGKPSILFCGSGQLCFLLYSFVLLVVMYDLLVLSFF